MRYVSWLITLPLTAFAVTFALLNQDRVATRFSPLHEAVDLPVYLTGLSLLGAGFILGALFVWIQSHKLRWARYQEARKVATLEKEIERLKSEKTEQDDSDDQPAPDPVLLPTPRPEAREKETVPRASGFISGL